MPSGIYDEEDDEPLHSASFSLLLGLQTRQSLAVNEGSKVGQTNGEGSREGYSPATFLMHFAGYIWLLDAGLEDCQLVNGTERLGKLEMGERTKKAADACGILYPRAIPRSPRSPRP